MYDATSRSDVAAHYSDAKEALCTAIGLAEELRDEDSILRLGARLAEIKAVFRSQFS